MKLRAGLRITGVTIFVVLAITLLSIGGLWTFAQTDRGGEIIRRIALRQIDDRIAGAIGVDRLRFGGDRLTLDGVELRDPDGAVVARVASIDLLFSPWALLRRHVDVRRLEIRRPELRLVIERRGSNLGRVFAPAHPSPGPPAPPSSPEAAGPNVVVDLHALSVNEGTLTVHSSAPEIHVSAIEGEGSASYAGRAKRLDAKLELSVEGGRAELHGAIDLARMQATPAGAVIRVRDLDLARLMRDTPASKIDLDLEAHGERLAADLRATAPGAAVTGHGALDAGQVEAHLQIEASDLAATARSLARCHLAPPVVLTGRGRIDLALAGPRTRPSLRVAGRIPQLTVGQDTIRGLTVSATIPRLDAPSAIDLDLAARDARLRGQDLQGIAATVRAAGQRLEANVQTAAPYPVALAATGHRLSSREIEIGALTLRYPEAAWTLAHAARVGFGEGQVSISGLDLRARDDEIVRVDLEETRRAGHLRLFVARLELGRLPRPLVPAPLASAGKVDLDLDLHFSPARLRGSVALHALGTGVKAELDLPASWPPRRSGRAPMQLTLTVDETDLAAALRNVAALTGKRPPFDLRGKVGLSATLDGNSAHPRLGVQLEGRALELAGRPIGDLALALEGDGDRPLTLRLDTTGGGGPPTALHAKTSLSLRALFARRPGAETLTRAPFEIDGHVEQIRLATLGKLVGAPIFQGGTISAQLAAHGSARDPSGTLAIDLEGVTTARIPATDARVEIEADQRTTQLNVRVVRLGHPLLALESRLGVGLQALRDRARLAEAQVRLRAVVGPLEMRRLGLPGDAGGGVRESALRGTLHADLAIDGTLRAPRLLAHVQTGDLRLDQTPVGYARLEVRYQDKKARLEAQLASANGGALTLNAGATADLGLRALLARKIDPAQWPFEVDLKAQKLDLRGFSGLTTNLRRAAGLFEADVTAHGTVRDPRFSGHAACTSCELQLAGVGDFRDIHLAIHGDNDKIVLDELKAKDEDGEGRVTASLARRPGGEGYDLTGSVAAKELPAYLEGQPLAHISLNAKLSGSSGGRGGVAKGKVEIDDAHVKLADEKRRQLQSLRTPDDVVILDDGQPIDRVQAKKLRALEGRHAPAPPAQEPAAAESSSAETKGSAGLWREITIAVTAPAKLWVNGGGAALELGLGPDFRVVIAEETRLHGDVLVRRGRIDALGRRFDLKGDSSLQFDGAPDHPTLDATAQYQDNDDNVTVVVTAKGPIDRLTIGISSSNRPDLTESQLYTLLISGHLPSGSGTTGSGSGLGTAASNEAASLVAGVIAGQLQRTLAKHLPFDVLTIDAGSGQGLTGTQLEAGRYVTDRLYVGYIGRIGADPTRYQNRNAVHVEYRLTSRWQIAGEYGDVGTGSADLMWKKSY